MKILNIDYLKLIVILDNQGTCVGFVINKIESFIVSIKVSFSVFCSLYEEIISSIYVRFWIGFLILEKVKEFKNKYRFRSALFFFSFHFCQL